MEYINDTYWVALPPTINVIIYWIGCVLIYEFLTRAGYTQGAAATVDVKASNLQFI